MLVEPEEQAVLVEPDLVTYSMVHLHTRVFAAHYMGHFQSLPTGLVQPVVATYAMGQLSAKAVLGLVTDDSMAVFVHRVPNCTTCCAR